MDCSQPDSSVHGILQARTLEWVALHQGIFPTQGSNLHLLCPLRWQEGSWLLVPPGKPLPILCPGSKNDTLPFFLSHYHFSIDHKSACNAGNLGSVSGLGRSPGKGKGYPLQYSGLYSPWAGKELDITERLSLSPTMNKDYFEHQGKNVV